MRTFYFSVLLMFSLSISTHAAEKSYFSQVPFDSFMRESIEPGIISLDIPVPKQYSPLDMNDSPNDYSYWMRKSDMKSVIKTGDLPAQNGYIYGKISLSVAYDSSKDIFVGVEDDASKKEMQESFAAVKMERYDNGKQPVVLIRFTDRSTNKCTYAIYIATGISTNAVYIAYRPENSDAKFGEEFFNKLRQSLIKSNYAIKGTSV